MPLFTVSVVRKTIEQADIEIEADSANEAHEKAENDMARFTKDANWRTENGDLDGTIWHIRTVPEPVVA